MRQIRVDRGREWVEKQANDRSDKDETMCVQGSKGDRRRERKRDQVNTKGENQRGGGIFVDKANADLLGGTESALRPLRL